MSTDEKQAHRRTPARAKVPKVSLEDALEPVKALAELGAPSTPHVIGQHLGKSYATDARLRTRLGAAGYYGLLEKDGEKRVLTKRGAAIAAGGDDAKRARQEAVMSTSFGPLIYSLRSRQVNDSVVAIRLQGDYGVPASSAPSVAQALIDAATEAKLVTNGIFDAAAIEAVKSVLPTETPPPPASGGNAKTTARTPKIEAKPRVAPKPKDPDPEVVVPEKERPFAPGVQVMVKIDATNLTPDQIAELVRALQKPQP
jgi:hypothetical protein